MDVAIDPCAILQSQRGKLVLRAPAAAPGYAKELTHQPELCCPQSGSSLMADQRHLKYYPVWSVCSSYHAQAPGTDGMNTKAFVICHSLLVLSKIYIEARTALLAVN